MAQCDGGRHKCAARCDGDQLGRSSTSGLRELCPKIFAPRDRFLWKKEREPFYSLSRAAVPRGRGKSSPAHVSVGLRAYARARRSRRIALSAAPTGHFPPFWSPLPLGSDPDCRSGLHCEKPVTISGSTIRELLGNGERPAARILRPEIADILIACYRGKG